MLLIPEIFTTCWLVLLANGAVHCYCEGEDPPVDEAVVTQEARRPVEAQTAP